MFVIKLKFFHSNRNSYYPLNWFNGNEKLQFTSSNELRDDIQVNNIAWLNQTGGSLKNLPGADKWIVGNYLKMFSLFRTNYDSKNWLMLTEQLLFNHKVKNFFIL